MAKNFSILRNAMSASAKAESEKKYKEALASMPLDELWHTRGISQKKLTEVLRVQQPIAPTISVPKMRSIAGRNFRPPPASE